MEDSESGNNPARMTADNNKRYRLKNVDEALFLIKLVSQSLRRMNLAELTVASGMSKNKTFRMLKTLELQGIIDKDKQERYYFGINSLAIARHALSRIKVPEILLPFLEEVAVQLNEDVYLARRKNGDAVLIAMASSKQKVRVASFVGSALRESPVDKKAGGRSCHEVIDGSSVSVGGLDPEITTVAIDIPGFSEIDHIALVVVAPTFRMPPVRIRSDIIPVLQETVRRMGQFQAESVRRTFAPATAPGPAKLQPGASM